MENDDLDMELNNELMALEEQNNNKILPNNDGVKENQELYMNKEDINEYTIHDISQYEDFISNHLNSLENKEQLFNKIEKANLYISEISRDILNLTEICKELYKYKFQELPSIVTDPYDYIKTIKVIEEYIQFNSNENSNNFDLSLIPPEKFSFLQNNIVMALTFMFTSSNYHKEMNYPSSLSNPHNTHNLNIKIKKIYTHTLKLYDIKNTILKFINENMKLFAPNLTALLGADIAGKLITCAGGIIELAKCPSGNILNMGTHHVNIEGFSSRNKLNNGYLTELEEYKNASENMKIKVLRRYSNKAALAAKTDAFSIHKVTDSVKEDEDEENNQMGNNNEYGKELKEKISEKLLKIENTKQPILAKPLPKPDDKPKRKRAGKKLKGVKKRYELTEARMLKNRMKFGTEPEKEYRDTGEGFGLLNIGGLGSQLRMKRNEKRIVTKKMKNLDKKYLNTTEFNNSRLSGMHSSVVMSNVNGIQLMNPDVFNGNMNGESQSEIFNDKIGFNTVIKKRLGEI